MTKMVSAYRMVDNLWAMTTVVTCPSSFLMLSIDLYTSASFFLSRADVASSKSSTLGFLIKALAIAILYFYPPPTIVFQVA